MLKLGDLESFLSFSLDTCILELKQSTMSDYGGDDDVGEV